MNIFTKMNRFNVVQSQWKDIVTKIFFGKIYFAIQRTFRFYEIGRQIIVTFYSLVWVWLVVDLGVYDLRPDRHLDWLGMTGYHGHNTILSTGRNSHFLIQLPNPVGGSEDYWQCLARFLEQNQTLKAWISLLLCKERFDLAKDSSKV